jgi:hypothetical protein
MNHRASIAHPDRAHLHRWGCVEDSRNARPRASARTGRFCLSLSMRDWRERVEPASLVDARVVPIVSALRRP